MFFYYYKRSVKYYFYIYGISCNLQGYAGDQGFSWLFKSISFARASGWPSIVTSTRIPNIEAMTRTKSNRFHAAVK